LFAQFIPNCRSYDPTFAYELAVIFHDGMKRMFELGENITYYITTMNENYSMPAMPEGAEEGIIKGMYQFSATQDQAKHHVQLLGCGTILREVIAAAELLKNDWEVSADIWSTPSLNELTRDGQDCERWNMLHPDQPPRQSWVAQCLKDAPGPVIASTDYMKLFAEQIRPFVTGAYHVLGTDGFGRSDSRPGLRAHFEVDRHYVTLAALKALLDQGAEGITAATLQDAMQKYGIDPEKPNPLYA
jgi:pyruvate dehydrogenase E1 component